MPDSSLSAPPRAMNEEFVQLSIWDLLEEAKLEPFEVDWDVLWDSLDVSLVGLGVSQQLQVASVALLQMVEVFHIRSMEAFDELEIYRSNDGAVMGDRDFAPFVRQFMDIDFDEFVEPLVNPIPRSHTHAGGGQSIVEVVDREVLLESGEESQESSPPEVVASVVEIAYEENVSDWVEAIANYFTVTGIEQTTWSELLENLDIAPVEIFLGLLLGNFALSQVQNELNLFYESEILIEIC
ncbi:MAG: hypothetical protein HC836_29480 [Richelia sp. RM2_1_2]|nr:hypothetical protein [Richelia sp. RM2_1_2]